MLSGAKDEIIVRRAHNPTMPQRRLAAFCAAVLGVSTQAAYGVIRRYDAREAREAAIAEAYRKAEAAVV